MTGKILDVSAVMDSIVHKTIEGLDKGYTEQPETYIADTRKSLLQAKKHLKDYVYFIENRADMADKPEDFGDPVVSKENALYAISTIDDMVVELM